MRAAWRQPPSKDKFQSIESEELKPAEVTLGKAISRIFLNRRLPGAVGGKALEIAFFVAYLLGKNLWTSHAVDKVGIR